MKKALAIFLVIFLIFGIWFLMPREYERAWDGFCYKISGDHEWRETIEGSGEKYIFRLLNYGEWEDGIEEIAPQYRFCTSRHSLTYDPILGIINDEENNKHLTLSSEQRERVNGILFNSSSER